MDGVFEDETDCKRILRELKILRVLKHQYVVELLDIIEPKDMDNFETVYIVLELAESDLKKVVKSAIHLTPVHIQTIVYNLLCAVKYLHSAKILHRDLKPANILVNEDCSVKICDFGLARSTQGVETAECIIRGDSMRSLKSTESGGDSQSDKDDDVEIGEPAKLTLEDPVHDTLMEDTASLKKEEVKIEHSAADKKRMLMSRL
jgi:serine/threonine protein kinase